MARGCWTGVLIIVVVIVGLAAVVGPNVYREGRAFVGPVVDMARSEGKLEALDLEFPFTPPVDEAEVAEERLLQFFSIRRELQPLYLSWRDTVETIEREHGDSWVGAKQALSATRDVMAGQIAALRNAQMSPEEFLWLEELVYQRWRTAQGDAELRARQQAIRELTEQDLKFVASLERRYGKSPSLTDLRRRLDERLAVKTDGDPVPAPGISPGTQDLLWRYRDVIDELDFAAHEMHATLGRRGSTRITVGDRGLEFDD